MISPGRRPYLPGRRHYLLGRRLYLPGRRLCLPRWGAGLCALLLAVASVAACGRRTAPIPVSAILPVPSGLLAWQRESELIVAWRIRAPDLAEQSGKKESAEEVRGDRAQQAAQGEEQEENTYGGLRGFTLWIDRLPLNCLSCPAQDSRKLALPLHAESMVLEQGRAHYRFPLQSRAATWRFRVAARYGDGLGQASGDIFMDTPASVPAHKLLWEPARREGETKGRPIRLYWLPRRERVVRILTREGVMVKQDRFFRANIYRRRAKNAPWPLRPLNIQPLQTGQLTLRIPAESPAEFQLRLVDQFGNEGPASPSVLIAPGARKP